MSDWHQRAAMSRGLVGRVAYTDEKLLAVLRRYGSIGANRYDRVRSSYEPTAATISKRLGGWSAALRRAGLETRERAPGSGARRRFDERAIRSAFHECAADVGRAPSIREYTQWRARQTRSYPSEPRIRQVYTSWIDALVDAGFGPT